MLQWGTIKKCSVRDEGRIVGQKMFITDVLINNEMQIT
jgi:hypothetical protein